MGKARVAPSGSDQLPSVARRPKPKSADPSGWRNLTTGLIVPLAPAMRPTGVVHFGRGPFAWKGVEVVASTEYSLPKARTEALLVERIDAETVVYDLDSGDVHCLSPLAAAAYEYCDGHTAVSRIAELAQERLGEPVTEDEISAAVAQLDERSLLETPPLILREGISRRDLAKRSAKLGAAAATVPLITSIVVPNAWAQGSGIPVGCPGCTKNQDCLTNLPNESAGHCCQDNPGKGCNQRCCVSDANSCHLVESNDPNTPCTVVLLPGVCEGVQCPGDEEPCCCCCGDPCPGRPGSQCPAGEPACQPAA